MNFASFATLFILSAMVSFVLHYLARYRFREGIDGFLGKVLVGWNDLLDGVLDALAASCEPCEPYWRRA